MDWKLLESKIVFDTFMKIEERKYEMPNGTVKNFYIKVANSAVCVLAITEDKKVITARQFRPGPNVFLNELPGGYIDEGETPQQAIIRELREETGYVGDVTLVTECLDDAYATMRRSCFVATDCKKVNDQELDDGESIDVELMSIPDFVAQIRSGQSTDVEAALLGLDHLGLL